jgi:replicative DNA helicase
VSVAELSGPEAGPSPGYDRTPPQDVSAEQSVLGGMLLSKDAIADVVEIVRGHDFYRPAHETVYETIIDLYGRGEPADPVTVAAELQKRGELGRIGGAPYLHTLVSSVPTAANAGFYAEIVRERAVLRRLVEAGTRIVQMGYNGDGDADQIVDRAQAEVFAVTDRRTSEDYLPLSAIMEGTLDEIEAIGSRGGVMVGVPTGFADLDQLTNGLHAGQMIVLAARPAIGKALALDTLLPTPTGWTTMGEIQVGDRLVGDDGRPTTVTAVTDVLRGRPCYEVELSDGAVVVADAAHGWLTETRASRRSAYAARVGAGGVRRQRIFPAVRTTEEIARTLRVETLSDRRLNHSVRNPAPMRRPKASLPLPPYILGVWLGDGHSASARYTSADPEVAVYFEAEGAHHGTVPAILRTLGVLGDKHIPREYLRASEDQRRALLAGLLDTDGTVTLTGSVQFSVTSRRLAMDVRELVATLGYTSGLTTKRVRSRSESSSTAYTITFSSNDDVFRLERKRLAHKQRRSGRDAKIGYRYIVHVRPIASVPVRCVEVDNRSRLYLAGPTMVPTHNSTLGLDLARSAAIKHQMTTVIFSLEMGRNEITMRLLSAEARVPLHHMRAGRMNDDDWNRIARRTGEVSGAPLFIDDSPNMTMMEIRAKCRRLKQRHDLRLVIVDYLQLMTSGKRIESRQQEVAEFSRALKLLAKELEVPVIAISQLNRGPEQRQDKKPMLSDLRESGCLTAATRLMRADTGAEVTLGELDASGCRDVPVWALDESLRYVPRTLTHVFPTGRRTVYEMRLASGKRVTATANHRFLTYDGWRPLAELAAGDRLGIPRHVPAPLVVTARSDEDVVARAEMLGDGSSPDTRVPMEIFGLPKRQVAVFLRHLWAATGSVMIGLPGHQGEISLVSASRRLLDDASRLLLRFGIVARVRVSRQLPLCTLAIDGRDDQLRFLRGIGGLGHLAHDCEQLRETIMTSTRPTPGPHAVPTQVWQRIMDVLVEGAAVESPQDAGSRTTLATDTRCSPAPHPQLARIADLLQDEQLAIEATNDVYWDEVVAIEPRGEDDVYDGTVMGLHNFVVDGVAAHNSIEQDADMVILLHREDAYEKESPRAGEADFIVAKHRNGPTATITVAFQGHYSRFVDMAQ